MVQKIRLEQKNSSAIKNPKIICGYQGFGLVGALTLNNLIENLDFEQVGSSELRLAPPMLTIKEGRMLKPLSILHNKESNIIAISILAPSQGMEWAVADLIERIYKDLGASEIVVADGIAAKDESDLFYISNYCKSNVCKKIESYATSLQNAVVGGTTAALLMKGLDVLCFLGNLKAGKQSISPASSAANVTRGINNYLGMDIEIKNLEELGEKMEQELEQFLGRMQKMKQPEQAYIG